MYLYHWYQWLAFFYIYCFFGWIFESFYVSIRQHHFVNRGFLRIPMLPLYGSGAIMMLFVSLPFKNHLFLVYLSGVIAATALEYITGAVMEQLFKIRYWDYSSKKFQYHGYICLSSSIAWGFLTIFMTEIIHEPIANIVLQSNQLLILWCTIMISVIFIVDTYESTKEALALAESLEAITELKVKTEELQERIIAMKEEAAEQISLAKGDAYEKIMAAKAETLLYLTSARLKTVEKLTAVKNETTRKLSVAKSGTAIRLSTAKQKMTSLYLEPSEKLITVLEHPVRKHLTSSALKKRSEELSLLLSQLETANQKRKAIVRRGRIWGFCRNGLLKRNPTAVSSKFASALKELKDHLEHSEHHL